MLLEQYLDTVELPELVSAGYVSKRQHGTLPLSIYNYTAKAQCDVKQFDWTDALSKCRGMVVDSDQNVVAFCQPKFWNLDPETFDEPGTAFIAAKADGSLGIIFRFNNELHVATRGSFHSEQADWANEYLAERTELHPFFNQLIDRGYTPHVEIIYDDNRIVIDYDFEGFVYLGAQSHIDWIPAKVQDNFAGRIAKQIHTYDWHNLPQRENEEGYVLYYPDTGNKYKLKNDWYLELHRVVFGLSDKQVLQQFEAGTLNQFIVDLPNEFQDEVKQKRQSLIKRYADLENDIMNEWCKIKNRTELDRKQFALIAKQSLNSQFLFMLFDDVSLDSNRWRKAICKRI